MGSRLQLEALMSSKRTTSPAHLLRWVMTILLMAATGTHAGPDPSTRPALIIDLTGLADTNARTHANEVAKAMLPEAPVHTIGVRGVIADSLRASARYSAIVPTGSAAERAAAALQVYRLTKDSDRTILAFDINEVLVPQQLRSSMTGWLSAVLPQSLSLLLRSLPDKTRGPALVAADVVARWKQDHPDGVVLIRGHSDGTWAVLAMLDALHTKSVAPEVVITESLRQDYRVWDLQAARFPSSQFYELGARGDLPTAGLVQTTPSPTHRANWTRLWIDEPMGPLEAHGAMTQWSKAHRLSITTRQGQHTLMQATVGEVLASSIRPILVTSAPSMVRSYFDAHAGSRAEKAPNLANQAGRVPVSKAAAEALLDTVTGLLRVLAADEAQSPGLRNASGLIAALAKFGKDMHKDIERSKQQPFAWVSSHTLEGIARLGLELVEASEDFRPGGRFTNLKPTVTWLAGLRDFVAVFGSVAGGKFDAKEFGQTFGASKRLVTSGLLAELERGLRASGNLDDQAIKGVVHDVKKRLLVLDALAPIAEALALRAEAGQWTIAAVDKMSDGVITASVSLLVFRFLPASRAAQATGWRDAAVGAAKALRSATEGAAIWSYLQAAIWGTEDAALELYAQHQAVQVRRGERILDVEEFFGGQDLARLGLLRGRIEQANEQTRLFNLRTAIRIAKRPVSGPEPEVAEERERARLKPAARDEQRVGPGAGFGAPGAGNRPDPGDGPGTGAIGQTGPPQGGPGGVSVDPQPRYQRLATPPNIVARIEAGGTP